MTVFVLDRHKKPLDPCSEKRARLLLTRKRARIHKLNPFTIRIVDRLVEDSVLHPLVVKLDPGSKTTGFALTSETVSEDGKSSQTVVFLAEVEHRGESIKQALISRSQKRRRRRTCNLRHRPARFNNRCRKVGWLPPSIQSRVDNNLSFVAKLMRIAPVQRAVVEDVKFDTQLMQNPDIGGVEYQRGTLWGYEVRQYLLEKYEHACAYCGAMGVPLQIEHVHPRSRGGNDRIGNLAIACDDCNKRKGSMSIEAFLKGQPDVLKRVKASLTRPLKDAAAVNASRHAIVRGIEALGLAVERATGGRTKFNRLRLDVPKTHALDAACAGKLDALDGWKDRPTLCLKAEGRGTYQRMLSDAFGFPRAHRPRTKGVFGFATGDLVVATVPRGLKMGTHRGRVAVRSRGSFNIKTGVGMVTDVSHRHCRLVARGNGYSYRTTKAAPFLPHLKEGVPTAVGF